MLGAFVGALLMVGVLVGYWVGSLVGYLVMVGALVPSSDPTLDALDDLEVLVVLKDLAVFTPFPFLLFAPVPGALFSSFEPFDVLLPFFDCWLVGALLMTGALLVVGLLVVGALDGTLLTVGALVVGALVGTLLMVGASVLDDLDDLDSLDALDALDALSPSSTLLDP